MIVDQRAGSPAACAWPGKLCQALAGPRIGIAKALDVPWRFGLAGSRLLNRPF